MVAQFPKITTQTSAFQLTNSMLLSTTIAATMLVVAPTGHAHIELRQSHPPLFCYDDFLGIVCRTSCFKNASGASYLTLSAAASTSCFPHSVLSLSAFFADQGRKMTCHSTSTLHILFCQCSIERSLFLNALSKC